MLPENAEFKLAQGLVRGFSLWWGEPLFLRRTRPRTSTQISLRQGNSQMMELSIDTIRQRHMQPCSARQPFAACTPRTKLRTLPLCCKDATRQSSNITQKRMDDMSNLRHEERQVASESKQEPARLKQALPAAILAGLIQAPASLAEQHSGLFAIAGEPLSIFSTSELTCQACKCITMFVIAWCNYCCLLL